MLLLNILGLLSSDNTLVALFAQSQHDAAILTNFLLPAGFPLSSSRARWDRDPAVPRRGTRCLSPHQRAYRCCWRNPEQPSVLHHPEHPSAAMNVEPSISPCTVALGNGRWRGIMVGQRETPTPRSPSFPLLGFLSHPSKRSCRLFLQILTTLKLFLIKCFLV